MRESFMYGSVRGARGNSRPYRDLVTHRNTRIHVKPDGGLRQRAAEAGSLADPPYASIR
jgi:hypothetical protein